jgi:hypothetical protein
VVERNNPIAHLFAGDEEQFASKNWSIFYILYKY